MGAPDLTELLKRPLSPPAPDVLAAVEAGPVNPVEALSSPAAPRCPK